MTIGQANETARRFGFYARREPLGFFLAPVLVDAWGKHYVGGDQMLVKHDGEIVVYDHSAQAFLAAKAVAAEMGG